MMDMSRRVRLMEFVNYYDSRRRAGHTYAAMIGACAAGATFVVHHPQFVRYLKKDMDALSRGKPVDIICIHQSERLYGSDRPLVVDHMAWQVMIHEAVREYEEELSILAKKARDHEAEAINLRSRLARINPDVVTLNEEVRKLRCRVKSLEVRCKNRSSYSSEDHFQRFYRWESSIRFFKFQQRLHEIGAQQ